jgi:hypothetical protein
VVFGAIAAGESAFGASASAFAAVGSAFGAGASVPFVPELSIGASSARAVSTRVDIIFMRQMLAQRPRSRR